MQKTREHEESLNEFRRQATDRLVKGTNVLRRAPLYIESHRSKKTYGEQMREILNTYLDFTLPRHELESFPTALPVEEIRPQIHTMEEYLFGLITEWKCEYNTLPLATENGWPTIEELATQGSSGGERQLTISGELSTRVRGSASVDQGTHVHST